MRVNLLKERSSPTSFNWKNMLITAVILILFGFMLTNYFVLKHNLNRVNSQYNKLNQQLQLVEVQVERFQKLQQKVNKLEKYKNFIEEEKYYWYRVLRELNITLPNNVKLNSIEIKGSQIFLKGESRSKRVLITYIRSIRRSSLIKNLVIEKITGEQKVNFSFKAVYQK